MNFDLPDAKLPELLALQNSYVENDTLAAEMNQLTVQLWRETLAEQSFDINVLGVPHLGSFSLVRRAVNADGLALLSGEGEEAATRYLYRAWKGRNGNGRGLHFLRTYMQMLYPNKWSVSQLWQDPALPYTVGMLTTEELSGPNNAGKTENDLVLTSRVKIGIDYDAPLATSFSEMRKVLASTIAARFVPEFVTRVPTSVGEDGDDGGGGGSSSGAHAIGVGVKGVLFAHLNPPIELPASLMHGVGVVGFSIARYERPTEIPSAAGGHGHGGALFRIARLSPMQSNEWEQWPAIPQEIGDADDFHIGLVTGYATGASPHWSHGEDSDMTTVQLLNQGMLPF